MFKTFHFILSQQMLEIASSNRLVSSWSASARLISLDMVSCGEWSCDETGLSLQSLRAGTGFVSKYSSCVRALSRRALAQRRQHSGFVMWVIGDHLRSLRWENLQYSIKNNIKVLAFTTLPLSTRARARGLTLS